MERRYGNDSPICLRDLRDDCPQFCRIHGIADFVTGEMAKRAGLTVADAKKDLRSENAIEINLLNFENIQILKSLGVDEICEYCEETPEPKFGKDE